ncbi:hypothetical protein ABIF38_008806 [Bradyrhizobium japonicum]|jgi:hypothetical protein|uniref:hypothetical protein n=1 Tax=Bradyrhizobium TaxID=374 RepID=UPI000362AB8A|nr:MULTISPECIES: hypothetical protein [Bradyrhizobium]MCS3452325.1 hypothetical protein [Bradyrhizobium elkanii]MCS3565572.1 hypothetical protein [Bradyrhizobium elkanii]MCS3594305.1 hypothetical protein [Bradyrhizobium elkanii]MCW2153696.1 hypothetical protein [Bradyrhizobium elkanii]MCW2356609.1 hypothetical protein [Bradyrhizobium elkanii]
MWKRFRSFLSDLGNDGFAVVGWVAAPLSLIYTLAKAFAVPIDWLRDLSYAWALAPLTVWFALAYVRRWFRTSKSLKQQALQGFYVSVGPIIDRKLPKDIPESEFDRYIDEVDAWVNSCADWIGNHMGIAARERFLDRTGMMAGQFFGAINKTHNNALQNLTRFRQNLLVLIESEAWG